MKLDELIAKIEADEEMKAQLADSGALEALKGAQSEIASLMKQRDDRAKEADRRRGEQEEQKATMAKLQEQVDTLKAEAEDKTKGKDTEASKLQRELDTTKKALDDLKSSLTAERRQNKLSSLRARFTFKKDVKPEAGVKLFDQHMAGVDLDDKEAVDARIGEFEEEMKAFLVVDVPDGDGSKGGGDPSSNKDKPVSTEERAKQLRGDRKPSMVAG